MMNMQPSGGLADHGKGKVRTVHPLRKEVQKAEFRQSESGNLPWNTLCGEIQPTRQGSGSGKQSWNGFEQYRLNRSDCGRIRQF
jgi:hypothetical protein